MEGVWPYNALLRIVLNIEFCNVFRGKKIFCFFPSMTFENTLLIDDMLHKSMFNLIYRAIFFKIFYGSHINSNHLLHIVLLYLESLHFSGMWTINL
jgi:hypothetical protein